jgi:predicted RNase H-like nuclease (RuvC/YqgF family)
MSEKEQTEPEKKNKIEISIEEYNNLKSLSSQIDIFKKQIADKENQYASLASEYEDFKSKKVKTPSKDEIEAELRKEYGDKLKSYEEQTKDLSTKIKSLTVTDKVVSQLQGKVVASAIPWLRQEIEKECDLEGDYSDGQVIVKDKNGNIRWSANQPDKKMDIDEYVGLLSSRYPDFFVSTARGGEKDTSQKGLSPYQANNQSITLQDVERMSDADLAKVDPKVLSTLLPKNFF